MVSYKEILDDVTYVMNFIDEADCDFCGSFCNTEKFIELLNNPSTKIATQIQIRRMGWALNCVDSKIKNSDERLIKIIEKYGL